jgi:hypothetical protein
MSYGLVDAAELKDIQSAKNNDEDQDCGDGFHGVSRSFKAAFADSGSLCPDHAPALYRGRVP